jgi:hypothetical protein
MDLSSQLYHKKVLISWEKIHFKLCFIDQTVDRGFDQKFWKLIDIRSSKKLHFYYDKTHPFESRIINIHRSF